MFLQLDFLSVASGSSLLSFPWALCSWNWQAGAELAFLYPKICNFETHIAKPVPTATTRKKIISVSKECNFQLRKILMPQKTDLKECSYRSISRLLFKAPPSDVKYFALFQQFRQSCWLQMWLLLHSNSWMNQALNLHILNKLHSTLGNSEDLHNYLLWQYLSYCQWNR